jgi:3-hydroxyacyl-[acyl-carrier-protein] dehydratase
MTLLGDFYGIEEWNMQEWRITARIRLNPGHAIFAGHFPGHPVVPGVCMLEIIKEILEEGIGSHTLLQSGENIKFLSPIDPRETQELEATLDIHPEEKGSLRVAGILSQKEKMYFKCEALFTRDNLPFISSRQKG